MQMKLQMQRGEMEIGPKGRGVMEQIERVKRQSYQAKRG